MSFLSLFFIWIHTHVGKKGQTLLPGGLTAGVSQSLQHFLPFREAAGDPG